MIASVIDASALLAFLFNEPGADVVEAALVAGAGCSTVNYSEVAQKVRAAGGSWNVAAATLAVFGLELVEARPADAVAAADLWQPGVGLSLADRFCLATAQRLGVAAITADRAWGESDGITQIR